MSPASRSMAPVNGYSLIIMASMLVVSIVTAGHHHVKHRIHVPQKVKTIYHTKIIKVPEHHHYIQEKEKIVKVPEHHHYIQEKEKVVNVPEHHHYFHEKEKEKLVDLSELHKANEGTFGSYDEHKAYDFGASEHNIYKKHAPSNSFKRQRKHVLMKIKT